MVWLICLLVCPDRNVPGKGRPKDTEKAAAARVIYFDALEAHTAYVDALKSNDLDEILEKERIRDELMTEVLKVGKYFTSEEYNKLLENSRMPKEIIDRIVNERINKPKPLGRPKKPAK